MLSEQEEERINKMLRNTRQLVTASTLLIAFCLSMVFWPNWLNKLSEPAVVTVTAESPDQLYASDISDGIHTPTGLIAEAGFGTVVQQCGGCHSHALVTQNRATREGWQDIIRWMQETQKLWDLGENEAIILDYLSTHYAPENKGRRPNLTNIEWYELEN